MNAVHDLPVLVAATRVLPGRRARPRVRDDAGDGQVTTSHTVKFDSVFDRPLDAAYNDGGMTLPHVRVGHHEARLEAKRPGAARAQDLALGASMSKFASSWPATPHLRPRC